MKRIIGIVVFSAMAGTVFAGEPFELNRITGKDIPQAAGNVAVNVPEAVNKGYIGGNVPAPVEWVDINGGKFTMGTDSLETGFEDARPIHEVSIKTFKMSKTAVTVEQYAECVIKGGCATPGVGEYCNWGVAGRQLHPVNCVNWDQAEHYARFKGARLPTEAEFEYAATSGGKNRKYPWGNDEPACDKAVMNGNGGYGCGKFNSWPVCAKPDGNTEQGLCDMAGNVAQWVQDKYQNTYEGAPADGGAVDGRDDADYFRRVIRGGSFGGDATYLRSDRRYGVEPGGRNGFVGFRLAKSL